MTNKPISDEAFKVANKEVQNWLSTNAIEQGHHIQQLLDQRDAVIAAKDAEIAKVNDFRERGVHQKNKMREEIASLRAQLETVKAELEKTNRPCKAGFHQYSITGKCIICGDVIKRNDNE